MPWSGALDLAPSWALFTGRGGATRRHAHLAQKLVVTPDPEARVEGGEPIAAGVWLVESGRMHTVFAPADVALLFLDSGRFAPLPQAARQGPLMRWARTLGDPGDRTSAARAFVKTLPAVADVRIARAAALLRAEPRAKVSELASRVRLSPTRLAHLFTAELGAAPRRYRTWGTLRRAVALLAKGVALTEVAHAAGFADSAHLSRAFVAMLGVVPSELVGACEVRLVEE